MIELIIIVFSVGLAVNIGLAVHYRAPLCRLHRRETAWLEQIELWNGLRQAEIQAMVSYREAGSWVIGHGGKGEDQRPYVISVGKN